jgi:hypothetical protein
MVDLSKVDMDAKQPIYADDDDNLYVYEPETGRIWQLKPGDYSGEPGHPLPGYVKGVGNLRMLGMFRLCY